MLKHVKPFIEINKEKKMFNYLTWNMFKSEYYHFRQDGFEY